MKRRYPCFMRHDGYPGIEATFVGPNTDLLEDVGVDIITLSNGTTVIEHQYSKKMRAALHTHVVEADSDEERALLAERTRTVEED